MPDADTLAGLHPDTLLIQGGTLRSQFGETSEAIFMNSGYVYENAEDAEARFSGGAEGYVYSRFANPTVTMFETRMALLEGAEVARATATGMAAVTSALLCCLKAGDHVVASRAMFGASRYVIEDLLPRFGISSTLIDGRDPGQWRGAVRQNTRVLFCESPANPLLDLVDLAGAAAIAKEAGALFMVDNVFATPMLQKPLRLGADVVIYSATKHIDGQGRCLGGVICAGAEFVEKYLKDFLRMTGPTMSPFNAWVLLKGLETLGLRVERHAANALAVARFLAGRDDVAWLRYPGLADGRFAHPQAALAAAQMAAGGGMISFVPAAGGRHGRTARDRAVAVCESARLFTLAESLGGVESLIELPAVMTHASVAASPLEVPEALIRLSVGIEDAADLVADLAGALDGA